MSNSHRQEIAPDDIPVSQHLDGYGESAGPQGDGYIKDRYGDTSPTSGQISDGFGDELTTTEQKLLAETDPTRKLGRIPL